MREAVGKEERIGLYIAFAVTDLVMGKGVYIT
jgi:hypothetical protein